MNHTGKICKIILILLLILLFLITLWGCLYPEKIFQVVNIYDEEWMIGKTMEEVIDRYGVFHIRDHFGYGCGYETSPNTVM